MNFLENITFRRNRTRSEPNDDESDKVLSQTLNCTTNSLPDISEDEDAPLLQKLKDEIAKLTSQLTSAHKEIEVLSLENSNLKKLNEEFNKKNDMYKKIAISPAKIKAKTTLLTPKKNVETKQTQTSEKDHTTSVTIPINITKNIGSKVNSTPNVRTVTAVEQPSTMHKICLISSETSNRLYTLAERTNISNFEICHYRKPTCGLWQILDNIEKKVQNFTNSDFCVIYIGEEDFRKTHNYLQLVMFVREKLSPLSHTNFIICLPTYKYMTDANIMFNSRIETFNNLLYLDISTCNYAYLLDSNLNLPYNYETYSKKYGTLNNYGMEIVVSDLRDLINGLSKLTTTHSEVDCLPQNQNSLSTESQQDNYQFFL